MNLTDDPTSYLTRDNDEPMVILASSVDIAMTIARQYGVAIQVNGPDPQKGIRVVTNEAEASQVIGNLLSTTLWAAIPDGKWTPATYKMLFNYFGPPVRMSRAMNVITKGIAWRPNMMVTA